uniref:DUF3835 domain-containing protein n=1 Tax=Steinernema glaseri TaxID=37863 RepID=A0A1I8A2F9_9BILA
MIGPALPPHLASKESSSSGPTSDAAPSSEVSSSSLVGPALPPQVTSTDPSPSIGPTLPPHLALSESDSPPAKKPKVEVEAAGVPVGPVLPSAKQEEPDDYDDGAIGPTLPPEVAAKLEEHVGSANEEEESFGPSLPPSMKEEDSDEEDFGPQLPGAEGEDSYEKRFIHYKIKEDQKRKENTKREEWMLKCPTKNKSYLPFSSDSSFGKTVQSKEVDSSETLLDKHQRKLKKDEAKKKDEPQERKAFNRDEDMSVSFYFFLFVDGLPSLCDEEQKNNMMSGGKKVDVNKLREHIGGLGSRFASSGIFHNDEARVDQAGDVAEKREKDVDGEVDAAALLEEHSDGLK